MRPHGNFCVNSKTSFFAKLIGIDMGRPKTNPEEDLGVFLQIAQNISGKRSTAELAKAIKLAHQSTEDIIERLEAHFGTTLIERPPTARILRLTEDGNTLVSRISQCLEPLRQNGVPFRVMLAHSLTQNRELMSSIHRFTEKLHCQRSGSTDANTLLELRAGMDLNEVRETENLLTGQLDLLLCWALPQRIARWTNAPGLDFKVFGPEYPLAIITHSRDTLRKCLCLGNDFGQHNAECYASGINFKQIVKHNCAVLDHDKQPLDDHLVRFGLYSLGKRRVLASSFHSIVELVRARIADVGIVPLNRIELDTLHELGEVFYHELPETLRIGALSRKSFIEDGQIDADSTHRRLNTQSQLANRLVQECHDDLNSFVRTIPVNITLGELPTDDEFLRDLIHGYYLFRPDEKLGSSDWRVDASWHYEEIRGLRLTSVDASESAIDCGRGIITNRFGQIYYVRQASVIDGALLIDARTTLGRSLSHSDSGFVSVFTAAVIDGIKSLNGKPLIIVGTWFGRGGRRTAIATWSTIFSSIDLKSDELNAIAREAATWHTLVAPVNFPKGDTTNNS